MLRKPLYIFLVIVVGASLIALAGWAAGTKIGRAYSSSSSIAAVRQRADSILSAHSAIQIGKSFPDIDLWNVDGHAGSTLSDLLQEGGAILYVSPSCGSCLSASIALQAKLPSLKSTPKVALIITDNPDSTPGFAKALRDSLVTCNIYCDATQQLKQTYGIAETPALFLISGQDRTLIHAGIWDEQTGFIVSK